MFLFAFLVIVLLAEAKGDKKKKKEKDETRVKAKALSQDVKNLDWKPAEGKAHEFLQDVAHLEFLNKWQKVANKVSKEIGPKSKNEFSSNGVCSAQFKCETVTNASTAKFKKDIKNPAKKLKPINLKSIDKFLTKISKTKTIKLTHPIQKGLVFAGEVHYAGIVARLTEVKKQEIAGVHAAGLIFDAYKHMILERKPSGVRAVVAQTDGQPKVMRAVCLFPKGSDKAQADNFCRGNDLTKDDEKDEDDEKGGKGGDKEDKDDDEEGEKKSKKEGKKRKGAKGDSEDDDDDGKKKKGKSNKKGGDEKEEEEEVGAKKNRKKSSKKSDDDNDEEEDGKKSKPKSKKGGDADKGGEKKQKSKKKGDDEDDEESVDFKADEKESMEGDEELGDDDVETEDKKDKKGKKDGDQGEKKHKKQKHHHHNEEDDEIEATDVDDKEETSALGSNGKHDGKEKKKHGLGDNKQGRKGSKDAEDQSDDIDDDETPMKPGEEKKSKPKAAPKKGEEDKLDEFENEDPADSAKYHGKEKAKKKPLTVNKQKKPTAQKNIEPEDDDFQIDDDASSPNKKQKPIQKAGATKERKPSTKDEFVEEGEETDEPDPKPSEQKKSGPEKKKAGSKESKKAPHQKEVEKPTGKKNSFLGVDWKKYYNKLGLKKDDKKDRGKQHKKEGLEESKHETPESEDDLVESDLESLEEDGVGAKEGKKANSLKQQHSKEGDKPHDHHADQKNRKQGGKTMKQANGHRNQHKASVKPSRKDSKQGHPFSEHFQDDSDLTDLDTKKEDAEDANDKTSEELDQDWMSSLLSQRDAESYSEYGTDAALPLVDRAVDSSNYGSMHERPVYYPREAAIQRRAAEEEALLEQRAAEQAEALLAQRAAEQQEAALLEQRAAQNKQARMNFALRRRGLAHLIREPVVVARDGIIGFEEQVPLSTREASAQNLLQQGANAGAALATFDSMSGGDAGGGGAAADAGSGADAGDAGDVVDAAKRFAEVLERRFAESTPEFKSCE